MGIFVLQLNMIPELSTEAGQDEVVSEVHPMDVDCIWFANTSEVEQFVLGEVVALRGFDKPGNQGE